MYSKNTCLILKLKQAPKLQNKKAAKRLLVLNAKMSSSQINYLVIKDTGITILEGIWIDIK